MTHTPLFVFILGTGRCGSTLVQKVLARHPAMGFMTGLEDRARGARLGRVPAALYRRVPEWATRKRRLPLAPTEGYRALNARVSPALSTPVRDLVAADATPWLAARTRALFEAHAAVHRRGVFVHKFSGWPRAGFLKAVFPTARFIHVVRDGRAVANSLLQMLWWRGYGGPEAWSFGPLPEAYAAEWEESGRSFPLLAGLEWKILIDAFERAASAVPEQDWLEVRYEDVIAHPGGQFARMLQFCGLAADGSFERGLRRHTFASGRAEAFRSDLEVTDVRMLSDSLAKHLARFGYPAR